MSERVQPESGLFTGRVEFYREDVTGEYQTNPEYTFFSDNPREVTHTPGLNTERRDGLGTADAVAHDIGNEEPELSVVYDLQHSLVTSGGDPDDPSADAWLRNADNRILNTHHVRIQEERESSDPNDPTGASGARIYVIGVGCHPNVEYELDPEGGSPAIATVNYMAEKVRKYEVFQPDSDGLAVSSTNSNDAMDITLEDDEGNTETLTLGGTSSVATTKTDWTSLSGFELSEEASGDVSVAINAGTEADPEMGDNLVTIRGAAYYTTGDDEIEGDLGVPVVDGGSLASDVNEAYVYFNGASVTRGGSELQYDLNRITASCENNYEPTPRHDSTRMRWNEGNRELTLESDLVGWGASANFHDEALGINGEDIVITMSENQMTFHSAVPAEPGDTERGPEDSAIEFSVTFEPSENAGGVSLAQV